MYYLKDAPMHKAIAHLSIPMMLGISAGTIYNIINAYFIGLVHDTAMLSAITLGLPIFTILMAVGNIFGVGGGTFITRLIAKDKEEEAKQVAGYSFYSSLIISILIALIAYLAISPLVSLLGADAVTLHYTKQYTITLFVGGFAIIWNFALEQIVRALGAAKESMYGMFISIVLSIILDVVFILLLDWHVVGAALSMVVANIGSTIYYIWYLERKSEHLKGFMKHFKLKISDQLEIYKVGVSELIQSSFMIVTTLLLNNYAISYGDQIVASFGIALRIVQLPEFIAMGLFFGIIPLLAYSFSNGNFTRLKSAIKQTAFYIAVVSLFFISLAFYFREPIMHIFSSDPTVLTVGANIMMAMLISALFTGFTGLFTGIFQASGEGAFSMIMAISQGVLFIPVVILMHHFFDLQGLIWSMTITEVTTCLIGLLLFSLYNRKLHRLPKVA